MPQELELFQGSDAPFSLTELLINLAIGVALALALRWHFLRFGATLSNRDELGNVIPFVSLTTILIITVVKSSLALSLGLVGALSIVRFRTPIKEPEELAYLFIAIAIGLGLGANQVLATTSAVLFILVVMTAIKLFSAQSLGRNLYLSVRMNDVGQESSLFDSINETIGKHVSSSDLRRLDCSAGTFDATYLLDISSSTNLSALTTQLQKQYPGVDLTFLDQNGMPGV